MGTPAARSMNLELHGPFGTALDRGMQGRGVMQDFLKLGVSPEAGKTCCRCHKVKPLGISLLLAWG